MSQLFAWGGQSTGVSASASFPPNKSQGWSPSEWTGWISLQSKGLSRVLSASLFATPCSPPGSSVYDIFQARILGWVAISFSNHPLENMPIAMRTASSPITDMIYTCMFMCDPFVALRIGTRIHLNYYCSLRNLKLGLSESSSFDQTT